MIFWMSVTAIRIDAGMNGFPSQGAMIFCSIAVRRQTAERLTGHGSSRLRTPPCGLAVAPDMDIVSRMARMFCSTVSPLKMEASCGR